MTKIDGRTKAPPASRSSSRSRSTELLQSTHVDLVQFHENIRPDDADQDLRARRRASRRRSTAQRAGKTRFIGFTGHKSHADYPPAHARFGGARTASVFDTVQMPLNVMDAHFESFERKVLPVANRLDMGVLAMKTFGDHHILDTRAIDPVTMLHYGMNLPVSVVVTGIDNQTVLDQAIHAATSFRKMDGAQVAAILAKTSELAKGGSTDRYKTTNDFDGTIQNPHWLDTATV